MNDTWGLGGYHQCCGGSCVSMNVCVYIIDDVTVYRLLNLGMFNHIREAGNILIVKEWTETSVE